MQEINISEHNFEQCQKCGICNDVCPMMAANPAYPGPKQAGPDGERYRLKDKEFYDYALKYCLNCKRCEVACPSGVKVPDIIQSAREKYNTHKSVKLRDMMLASTDLMGTMVRPVAPIANTVLGWGITKSVLDGVMAIDHRRTFPKYSGEGFEKWFKKKASASQASFKHQISYFHGCYVNYNYPQLGKDFVTVMNALGYGVNLLDGEKCCGVAMVSAGMFDKARKNAENNIKVISEAKGDKVLTTSTSCTLMMRDEYKEVLGMDNSSVRDSIVLALKFIYELVDQKKVKLVFKKDYKARAAYHVPCHMEKLGWSIFTRELLGMIPGLELILLDSNCCGISGTFGFKKENYEISQKIGKPLFDQIEAVNPDFVACECETCKWQIEMSTKSKVKNPISILAEALDLEATAEANK